MPIEQTVPLEDCVMAVLGVAAHDHGYRHLPLNAFRRHFSQSIRLAGGFFPCQCNEDVLLVAIYQAVLKKRVRFAMPTATMYLAIHPLGDEMLVRLGKKHGEEFMASARVVTAAILTELGWL